MNRGIAGMMNPRKVIADLRTAYIPRFGEDFTHKMVSTAKVVLIGAWVMMVALGLLVVLTVVMIVVTHSLPDGFLTAFICFGGIVVGYIISAVGTARRASVVAGMSQRIMTFDPNITTAGAARLIHIPQLYDRWMAQHPGFVSH